MMYPWLFIVVRESQLSLSLVHFRACSVCFVHHSLRPAAAPRATLVSVQRGTFFWEPGKLVFRILSSLISAEVIV